MNWRSSQLKRALSQSQYTVFAMNWTPCNEYGLDKLYEKLNTICCSWECFDACDCTPGHMWWTKSVNMSLSSDFCFVRHVRRYFRPRLGFEEEGKKIHIVIIYRYHHVVIGTECTDSEFEQIYPVRLHADWRNFMCSAGKRYRYTLLHYTPQHQRQQCFHSGRMGPLPSPFWFCYLNLMFNRVILLHRFHPSPLFIVAHQIHSTVEHTKYNSFSRNSFAANGMQWKAIVVLWQPFRVCLYILDVYVLT